jgi:N utilization substance protein B
MGRHEQREQVFKLLFRVEFNLPEDMPEQVRLFTEDNEEVPLQKDADYIQQRFAGILEKLPEIDKLVNEHAEGWNTQRMGKVELTVLRLAIYEIMFDKDIPDSVAINEAVEIAKTYGQSASGGFVNAVLAKIAKLDK